MREFVWKRSVAHGSTAFQNRNHEYKKGRQKSKYGEVTHDMLGKTT